MTDRLWKPCVQQLECGRIGVFIAYQYVLLDLQQANALHHRLGQVIDQAIQETPTCPPPITPPSRL